jgi:hypothetical protein
VLIDEGVAIQAAQRKKVEDWFLSLVYSLRHYHIALLYAVQNATSRSWHIIDQSTTIHVFATHHAWALDSLRAAGVPDAQLERIESLARFERVSVTWETLAREKRRRAESANDSAESDTLEESGISNSEELQSPTAPPKDGE